jgi:hypothetical protein
VRSDVIGIMRIATNNAAKRGLRGSIGFIHVFAAASARCVAGVDRFNFDTVLACPVLDLQEERRERSSAVNQSLLFGDLDSRANAFEVFDISGKVRTSNFR